MLFTSLEFFAFLPLVLLLFSAMPVTQRWAVLLLASYLFYGIWQPFNLVYLGAVTLVVYGCGWALERATRPAVRKALLALGLVALLGSLAAFKFYDFVAGELERALASTFPLVLPSLVLPRLAVSTPVGYSFYAFSAASYLIDIYARRLSGGHYAGHVALYVGYFPKIFAGPIERATAFLPQIVAGLRGDPRLAILGLQLIGWGLFKKVVIADNLAPLVDRNFGIVAFASPMELLISIYFFAFQIYCDFSGYTDIAIGASLLFGLQLMENFRRPYLSRSTAEFWGERWHISLGRWFRDYLYIPMGGSRAGPLRRYVNIMVVFVVSGLWHAGLGYGVGWTFLIWGALNGAYQWIGLATGGLWQRLGDLLPAVRRSAALTLVRILLTFHLIAISWIFFRAKSVGDALTVMRKIVTNLLEIPSLVLQYPFTWEHGMGFGLIALLLAVETLDERRPLAGQGIHLHAVLTARRGGGQDMSVQTMTRQGRSAIAFIGIGLLIYAGISLAAERLMYRNGHSNPFFKIATTDVKAFDWMILGASHAMPLDFADFNGLMQGETGLKIINLASPGTGPLYNRFVLEAFLRGHTAKNVLYIADSFAFYSRTWNEERFGDAKLLRATPFDPATAWLLLQYSRRDGVDPRALADYVSGFSKINNRDRFQKDVWEGELQFDRVYRQSAAAVKSRIAYLFPESGQEAGLSRYLTEFAKLLELAEQRHIRVVVIKMPTPGQFRALLPNEPAFDVAMAGAAGNHAVGFSNFSAELDEPRFYFDTDHLNRAGVTELFNRHLKAILIAPAN